MKTFNNHKIAQLAIYTALMIILIFVPYTGFISIGIVSFTIIPVVIALATYHHGFVGAMLTSILFGIGSFVLAMVGITHSILFTRPEISILPRVFLGLIVYGIYKLLGQIRLWKFMILSALTVIINTSLVTGFMFMTAEYDYQVKDIARTLWVWLTLIWLNFTIELSASIVLSMPLFVLAKSLIQRNIDYVKNSW